MIDNLLDSSLGKKSGYEAKYNPLLLFPIQRAPKRIEIDIDPTNLPFYGIDLWNHYEVSWLNPKGKPIVAIATIQYDCQSPKLIESKSLKLYFNSFNQTFFKTVDDVEQVIRQDLSQALETAVQVKLLPLSTITMADLPKSLHLSGENIDELDITCADYMVRSDLLKTGKQRVEEILSSNLLKSNCLVTNQPDWGSIQICYSGLQIDKESLLQYLVSFRNHNEFHEQCIERIFIDILVNCKPTSLTVYGRYTRRGGIDINPIRSTDPNIKSPNNAKLIRQ